MADKEERILITKCSSWCHALRVSFDPFDDDDGMYCDKSGKWVRITEKECAKCKDPVLLGLSSSEAIERMAKAMCKQTNYQCSVCEVGNNKEKCEEWILFQYKTQAEAALKALLEGMSCL